MKYGTNLQGCMTFLQPLSMVLVLKVEREDPRLRVEKVVNKGHLAK